MTITGTKGCLWDIFMPNPKLMIIETKINLREENRPLEMVEQVIYSGKWILILDSDFVKLPIIDTNHKGSILLSHKQHWSAARGYSQMDEALII